MPKVRELDKDFNKANLYGYIERIFVIIFQTLFKGDIDLFRQYIEKVNNNINTLDLNYILKELRSNGKLNINHPKRKMV